VGDYGVQFVNHVVFLFGVQLAAFVTVKKSPVHDDRSENRLEDREEESCEAQARRY
jgi:hypothetical protein